MLILNFPQIRISHLKIRYKSGYRFCTLAHYCRWCTYYPRRQCMMCGSDGAIARPDEGWGEGNRRDGPEMHGGWPTVRPSRP